MKPIRVLVVDDSPTIRSLIRQTLARESDMVIVAEAEHPLDARQAIKDHNPDVLTLDIEMPHMSGLEFLEKIMRLRPMPVIIVSTLTRRGASETLRALELGAVDCIEKPRPGNEESFNELAARIRIAARADAAIRRARHAAAAPVATPSPGQASPFAMPAAHAAATQASAGSIAARDGVIAIGASTGGVEALLAVLGAFPADCPPTVIVQHMPPVFTTTFAARLDRACAPRVVEATHGARLLPGTVHLAPGGSAHLEISGSRERHCVLRNGERVNHHCPSVDVLFNSVAQVCGAKAVGILLTGMGRDGADGLLRMRQAGARTIGQDEATSVVYGMPRAAHEIGAVERQLPLERIAREALSAGLRTEAAS